MSVNGNRMSHGHSTKSGRALLLTEMFPPKAGGSSRWFWEIYRRMPRSQTVIAAGFDDRQHVFDQTHSLRLFRSPLGMSDFGMFSPKGLWNYGRAYRAIRRIIQSEGVSRLHCGRCVPEGWLAWLFKKRMGIPYVCYVHGEEVKLEPKEELYGLMASRQLRWMVGKVLANTDFCIANSQNSKRILTDEWKLPADRVRVLHPGVDTTRFVPAPRDHEFRKKMGWNDRPILLTVGRLQKRKGVDQLIRALPIIRRSVPNVLYAVVGEGEERGFIERLIRQEDLAYHVQLLGELQDKELTECYQQCDLFVLPNRRIGKDIEGFGMVLLEAQACGKAVVAGASGGTAETMRIPETGQVVDCDDVEKLADLLVDLLSHPQRLNQMSESARQWVVDHFDWQSLAHQAEGLFGFHQALSDAS